MFIGDALATPYLEPADKRHLGEHFRAQYVEVQPVGDPGDQRSPWWPGSGFVGGQTADIALLEFDTWGYFDTTRGSPVPFVRRIITVSSRGRSRRRSRG